MSPIDERLKSLNIVLPDVMPPVVDGYVPAFAPFTRSGDQIHLSGRLGKEGGKLLCGKVGEEISLDQGKLAARHVAVELLAVLKAATGDLGCVRRIVKLFVMVNGAPHFTEPHRVADGASELLVRVFGERGIHSRSAVSVAQLPFGACVEIDMIAELEATERLDHTRVPGPRGSGAWSCICPGRDEARPACHMRPEREHTGARARVLRLARRS
jgi:enamine deaminase RidA (YjgF/YER057c/UK114 family)